MENLKKNREKEEKIINQYILKIMKVLRTASLGPSFTGSYIKKNVLNSISPSQLTTGWIRISISSFSKKFYFHIWNKWKKAWNMFRSRCYLLIIMDTFKGEDNDVITKLCKKQFVILHNLPNEFKLTRHNCKQTA